jgi:cold-inducible RNA-binding protein
MANKLYIGGMSWDTTEEELQAAFKEFGEVVEAKVITDRETGRSRGFGFITYANRDDANTAIDKMNGKLLGGRTLTVNEAREKTSREGDRRNYGNGPYRRY